MTQAVIDYIRTHQAAMIEDLQSLLRQPSVAIQDWGMTACADLLCQQMATFGIPAELLATDGYPFIYSRLPGTSDRTLLIYGHYDVQPANETTWEYDPFSATLADGRIYARGAVDDKGPVMAVLQALRAYVATGTPLPVTVILAIEGEEEIGSPNLAPFMQRYRARLQADALANFDDNVWPDGRPRVVSGVKGSVRIRLEARRPREFHGMMAPLVENALWRLQAALGTLRTPDGRITIDDFYDDVRDPTAEELEALRQLPWDGKDILRLSGQTQFVGGLAGLEALNQLYLQPSCGLTGLEGGYVRPMRKGVVPDFGAAELDFRTVPNQSGARIAAKIRAHLDQRGFDDVQVELMGELDWFRCSPNSPIAKAMGQAIYSAFGVEPARQPTYPGCGPEPLFAQILGIQDQAYSGFGPTEDRLHAANEYIRVEDYLRGIECVAQLLHAYAQG